VIRRSLQWKVILTIVMVGILPLTGGLLWAGLYGKAILIKASGEKFSELAKLMSSQINFIIEREIHEAQSLALSEDLLRAVTDSNSRAKSSQDVRSRPNPQLLRNEASRYLQAYQNLKEDEYDVIFATDRFGRVVASTRSLQQSTYTQEAWWQVAYDDGRGAVFMTGLQKQTGDEHLHMDLALPIPDRETKQAIGVLKFVIKDLELEDILKQVRIGTTGHAMLIGESGRVLICPLHPTMVHRPITLSQNPQPYWSLQENGHGEKPTVIAFAPVPLTIQLDSRSSGLKSGWIAITQERNELFAPIDRVRWTIMGLGTIFIALLAFLGFFAGRRLMQPILALKETAQALAQGNLEKRIRIKTQDELEVLADTINHMAERLQQRSSELLAARDYLRNIIEQSPALIMTTSPTLEIKEFNRGAEEILQYSKDQIVGKSLDMIWDDPEEFHNVMAQLTTTGQRIHYETAFARQDGTPVPISCSLTQLTEPSGKAVGLVIVGENISHRKQLEEAHLHTKRLTELHRLSTILTHDLRSPMVGILKALTLLQETYGKMPEDQGRQLLSDLVQGGDLLLGTLNDLLDVYRHSLDALPLRYTEFWLTEAIEKTLPLLEVDATSRGIKLELKSGSGDLKLSADRRRIQRVIFNLLDNAIKHSPPGGSIILRVGTDKDQVHIEVEDDGPGIPPEEQPKIFDFLYEPSGQSEERLERTGIGVGLYFCKMTVQAHGGRIRAENRPEGGARFSVDLPLKTPRKETA
jgi:PAS domain S-box-containing protein